MELIIYGNIRSKKNSKRIFKRGKYTIVLPSKAYVAWEKSARDQVEKDILRIVGSKFPIDAPIEITAKIYFKGQRPDLSGALESIGDAFEGYLWENDKQIESWDGSRLHHDIKNPRVELTIRQL